MYISTIDAKDLDEGESATIYFVAGYVGRSIAQRNKCDNGKDVLISEETYGDEDMNT